MQKTKSLAEFLDVDAQDKPLDATDVKEIVNDVDETTNACLDITDPKQFCQKILESREFRRYIFFGFTLGNLPPAVVIRVMDHGWGKPPEKFEHTGANGEPIKTVTEIRRVIVHPRQPEDAFTQLDTEHETPRKVTH